MQFLPKRRPFASSRTKALVSASLVAITAVWGLSISNAVASSSPKRLAPITIGYDNTESGPFAPGTEYGTNFFMAWIQYTNSHGGVLGHKINVINLDDKADAGQVLLNFETLWSQDHVPVIVKQGGSVPAPYPYIKANNIPVVAYQGDPRLYSSYYPSIIADGDNIAEVGVEVEWWLVNIEHKHPKIVAYQFNNAYSTWNGWQTNYIEKLGATTVYPIADEGVSADCTAIILQMKAEGVQFFNMEGTQAPECVLAMARLGWRPVDGAGGSSTSSIGQTELIGQPYTGLVSGSPMSLYNGLPIFSSPSAANKTYEGNVIKYAPQYANYSYLNGTTSLIGYSLAELTTYLIQGSLTKYGKVTPNDILKYAHTVHNWNNDLEPPVTSFSSNCKTGSDGTIWGFWHYNPTPTSFRPTMYLVPTSGPNWISAEKMLKVAPCALTAQADEAYPNG